jgi:hypothetical protein
VPALTQPQVINLNLTLVIPLMRIEPSFGAQYQ